MFDSDDDPSDDDRSDDDRSDDDRSSDDTTPQSTSPSDPSNLDLSIYSPLPPPSFDPPPTSPNSPHLEYTEIHSRIKSSTSFERSLLGESSIKENDWTLPSKTPSQQPKIEPITPLPPSQNNSKCPKCSSILTPLDTIYIQKFKVCQSCRSNHLQRNFCDVNEQGATIWDVRRMARGGDEEKGWKVGSKGREVLGGGGEVYKPRKVNKPRMTLEFGDGEEDEVEDKDIELVQFAEGGEEGEGEEEEEDAEYNYVRWLEEELEESRSFVRMLLRRVDRLEGRKKEEGRGRTGGEEIPEERKEKMRKKKKVGEWEKVRDEETGDFFFMNAETGEQRWELDRPDAA
ncbi:hypothetical protein TrVE_jg2298 [Triparma verrucosa]|uniref:WW domain-containing protein n=1 Tax=Triparma verrucosa TaxID=1606542 RepID=A0A9W7FKB9_9STRA|nr:hypothetical protein TrVE_jg2298 [Triparma verrucosa]